MIMCENKETDAIARIPYIDVARGLLIIMVVMGHLLSYDTAVTRDVKAVIYTFHLPAFLIISGLLANPSRIRASSFMSFFLRKVKHLLIPYCFFELTGGLFQMLLMGTSAVNLTGIVYGMVTLHCNIGANWFIPTLFIAELLLFFCVKISRKKFYFAIYGAVSFLIALLIPDTSHFVGCIRRIFVAFTFISIGIALKKWMEKKSVQLFLLTFLSVLGITYINGRVDLYSRQFQNPVLYLLGGTLGCYATLCASQYIHGKVSNLLQAAGRNSIIIMGTHQNVIIVANMILGGSFSVAVQLLLHPITVIYEYIMIFFISKRIPWVLGKFSNSIVKS